MQTIISYTHGASGGDLSEYALKADQEKDVVSGTISDDIITLIHRDGTNTDLPISDAVSEYLAKVEADNADIDSLF